MFRKHIWVYDLFAACLVLALGGLAWAGPEPQARALELVRSYGQDQGGPQGVGSLVELNMRQWKPQSNRGIAVLGWEARRIEGQVYRVVYRYQEMGLPPVELPWRVDLSTGRIAPLSELSARIQQMSLLL